MEKIFNILIEVLANNYIKRIEYLVNTIDWDNIDVGFNGIKISSNLIIKNIQNIGEYDGDNAVKYLNILKSEAKNVIYVLENILEYQNNID